MKLSDIKGVGPKRIELFRQLHIETLSDLLRFYPKEYLDYTTVTQIRDAVENQPVSLRVTVLSDPTVFYYRGKSTVSVRIADASGKATIKWINQPYRAQQIHAGETLYVNGKANRKRGVVFFNPQIGREDPGIIPVYPTVKGLTQKIIRDTVAAALSVCAIPETLPLEWPERFGLTPAAEAIRTIHQPTRITDLALAKKRLSFEEALLYFLNVASAKADHRLHNGFAFSTAGSLESFLRELLFAPTDAQLRVMREVESDLCSSIPMNRLVQGDVGSGKTLIAQYALSVAVRNHKQGVLLAPTSILAEQHYATLRRMFPNACLYTGSLNRQEREQALSEIRSGKAEVIVGTHALFSDPVRFCDLGLVVTDEQHRFGVMQRGKMEAKGIRPDVLVMSATPIPRTLALLLYSDLDLSVIDELPHGRKPIKTYFVPQNRREAMYRHLAEQTQQGERSYIVCPLIEATEGYEGLSVEEISAELSKLLPEVRFAVLHGQMHDDEKRRIMEDFRAGNVTMLISTTVIEVGVDVPEATAMVIEGCDHFGLATLHQLRGRVGRGDRQSYCYLLCDHPSAAARERIETMVLTNDGFAIAQKDLMMRGMGDLFGVRQSGEGELSDSVLQCPTEVLELAKEACDEVMRTPNALYNDLIREAQARYRFTGQIAHN